MALIKPNTYANSVALSITVASLASTVADPPVGREGAEVDNSSNRYEDAVLDGKLTTGTTPTVDRSITVCGWAAGYDGTTVRRPAGITGADAGLTLVAKGAVGTLVRPLIVIPTNATSNQEYRFAGISFIQAMGLLHLPIRWGIFIFHDTVAALNATGSNHEIRWTPVNRVIE